MKEHYLYVEKYRPSKLEDLVGNSNIKDTLQEFINSNNIPHLLFAGSPGIGKTTVAKILVNSLDCDWMYINASDENNIDTVRNKIKNFASTISFKGLKVIIYDEADFLSMSSMSALRSILEQYSLNTRFIFTCNYASKIIDPILSRLQVFELESMSKLDIAKRCKYILDTENIKFQPKDLKTIIDLYYPDIRKIINELQKNSTSGELQLIEKSLLTDYKYDILKVLQNKQLTAKDKFEKIRIIIYNNSIKDFSALYTLLYSSIETFHDDYAHCIITIQTHQYQDSFSVDKEICFMSCIVTLLNEG